MTQNSAGRPSGHSTGARHPASKGIVSLNVPDTRCAHDGAHASGTRVTWSSGGRPWHVCTRVCMCPHTRVWVCACMCMNVHTRVVCARALACMCTSVYTHVCMCGGVRACAQVCTHTCVCTCGCVCMNVCVHMWMCVDGCAYVEGCVWMGRVWVSVCACGCVCVVGCACADGYVCG